MSLFLALLSILLFYLLFILIHYDVFQEIATDEFCDRSGFSSWVFDDGTDGRETHVLGQHVALSHR